MAHDIDLTDHDRAIRMYRQVEDLKTRWNSVRSNAENKKRTLLAIEQFKTELHDVIVWLTDVEKQLKTGNLDEQEVKAFEEEMKRRQLRVDAVTGQGNELIQQGAKAIVEPDLSDLGNRWSEVNDQLIRYRGPSQAAISYPERGMSRTTRIVTVTTTTDVGRSAEEYIADLQQVLREISQIKILIRSPELHGKEFEDFSKKELILKKIKESIDSTKIMVDNANSSQRDMLSHAGNEDTTRIRTLLDQITIDWRQVNSDYEINYRQWTKAADQWQQFNDDIKHLNSWLDEAEKKSRHLMPPNDETVYKEIEAGIKSYQGTVNVVNATGNDIIRQSSVKDAGSLRTKLDTLNQRWKALSRVVLDRHDRSDAGSVKTSDFTDDMDDLFFWIDETENIMSSFVTLDEEGLEELLEKIRDREDDVASRQQVLGAINRNGQQMLKRDSLSPQDKENIQKDLENLNARFSKVINEIPHRIASLESRLHKVRTFQLEVEELQSWLTSTKQLLEAQHRPGSVTAMDENDSIVVDPQTTKEAVQSRRSNVESVNTTYSHLMEECAQQEVIVPDSVQQQINHLNSDWEIVQKLVVEIKPVSSMKVEEVLTQVKIARTETAHSVMSSSPWPDFDKSVAELRDWLTLLERMLKSQRVTVGDVSDIEHTINSQQTVLQDMQSKRPKLDNVLSTAEDLQKNSTNEQERQLLKDKAEKLKQHWELALAHVNHRKNQLDDMLIECRQFDEIYAELERWLTQVEEELESNPVNLKSKDLDKQIDRQKTLQSEVEERQKIIDSLKKLASKLIDDYSKDDTSHVKLQLEKAMNRWSSLLQRLAYNIKTLQNNRHSVQQLDSTLDSFISSLVEMEKSFNRLAEETSKQEVLQNKDLCKVYLEQFKDLQAGGG
ncbi:hypothetical protein KUTeg_007547 [Tegillarca granosa]|uniref:Nesprin-1 spectrin repeats region domain-containing protein n=1 Tax=Tegillarca granosa TaxID=220873 RepID=A0ABQ9FDI8_TEGGR|nr:hypothetical protein KUTeg_007547 [Tegillarca granosa]